MCLVQQLSVPLYCNKKRQRRTRHANGRNDRMYTTYQAYTGEYLFNWLHSSYWSY